MFLIGCALLRAQFLDAFQVLEGKGCVIFFQVEINLSCALLLCFLQFMALLCAGVRSMTSVVAFALPFCRTRAIAGGCVPPNAVQSLEKLLFPASSLQVPGLMLQQGNLCTSHEMYQALHVARETSRFRHSPKCAFLLSLLSLTSFMDCQAGCWWCGPGLLQNSRGKADFGDIDGDEMYKGNGKEIRKK